MLVTQKPGARRTLTIAQAEEYCGVARGTWWRCLIEPEGVRSIAGVPIVGCRKVNGTWSIPFTLAEQLRLKIGKMPKLSDGKLVNKRGTWWTAAAAAAEWAFSKEIINSWHHARKMPGLNRHCESLEVWMVTNDGVPRKVRVYLQEDLIAATKAPEPRDPDWGTCAEIADEEDLDRPKVSTILRSPHHLLSANGHARRIRKRRRQVKLHTRAKRLWTWEYFIPEFRTVSSGCRNRLVDSTNYRTLRQAVDEIGHGYTADRLRIVIDGFAPSDQLHGVFTHRWKDGWDMRGGRRKLVAVTTDEIKRAKQIVELPRRYGFSDKQLFTVPEACEEIGIPKHRLSMLINKKRPLDPLKGVFRKRKRKGHDSRGRRFRMLAVTAAEIETAKRILSGAEPAKVENEYGFNADHLFTFAQTAAELSEHGYTEKKLRAIVCMPQQHPNDPLSGVFRHQLLYGYDRSGRRRRLLAVTSEEIDDARRILNQQREPVSKPANGKPHRPAGQQRPADAECRQGRPLG